jgi:hypothetical protein
VPITIKEEFEVAGKPSAWDLPSRANELAEHDGPLMHRLREAGFGAAAERVVALAKISSLRSCGGCRRPLRGRPDYPARPPL